MLLNCLLQTFFYQTTALVKDDASDIAKYTNKDAFMVITGEVAGVQKEVRLTFELFWGTSPRTCLNFAKLCEGYDGMGYAGSTFHRIIKGFMMQGGDFTNHNGTGGRSIFGEKFEDENFTRKHTEAGMLSMANAGPNTNGSQFFITFAPTHWLDGKHVVFGRLRFSSDLSEMMLFQQVKTGEMDKPSKPVSIKSSGLTDIPKEVL